jgi:thiol-disulfide isomerase/thioredoxin
MSLRCSARPSASPRRAALLWLGLSVAACGGPQVPSDAKSTVISLAKIDCAECGDEIVGDLRQRPGVYDAKFDKRKAEITVVASPSFDVYTEVKRLAANEGFEALLGRGKGVYLGWAEFPEGADVATVVRDGVDVPQLESVLVKGKVTVVDFSATWCSPCRKVDAHMVGVLGARKDVAYRRLEIGDWDTPLARRYLQGVPSLPHVIVYGPDGQKVEAITGLDLPRLDAAIARGAGGASAATPH